MRRVKLPACLRRVCNHSTADPDHPGRPGEGCCKLAINPPITSAFSGFHGPVRIKTRLRSGFAWLQSEVISHKLLFLFLDVAGLETEREQVKKRERERGHVPSCCTQGKGMHANHGHNLPEVSATF